MELVIKKFKRNFLFYLLIILIAADALVLLHKETRFTQSTQTVDPRYEVILKTRSHDAKTLEYLVAFSERQAEAILPSEQEITQTFVYGGNPCALYYSGKKVNYYYSIDKFKKRLKGKGLFLLENGDLKLIKGLPARVIHQNKQYTLFERS